MSRSSFDKLKNIFDSKSNTLIRIQVIAVNQENRTISAKYAAEPNQMDITKMDMKELKSRSFNATVVSVHDFGVFAKLEGADVDGLIPASLLPDRSGTLAQLYPTQDVSPFEHLPKDKYITGVVQKVIAFGLIMRPVGYDVTGLMHSSQVPRSLVTTLKKRLANITDTTVASAGVNKTDVELLFTPGDVFKMRVNSVNKEANKVEFSLHPYKESEDYAVNDEIVLSYDSEDLLLWWRGELDGLDIDLEEDSIGFGGKETFRSRVGIVE
ncbi:unnamed protein product [Sphagnum jensenii]|uniref:S1 motif domain-containing protein n=1 Tax=Sphagnum jensenii TaxID=128206 RepID=A0ABP0VBQ7_9BRYO